MLKMTVTLAVALYGGLVVFGAPSAEIITERSTRGSQIAVATIRYDKPIIVSDTINGFSVAPRTAADTINASSGRAIAATAPSQDTTMNRPQRIGEPMLVSLVQPDIAIASSETTQATNGMLRVAGSRVNMRSGPSTSDSVVDSLPGGTLAERIGAEHDGWVEIRDVASGRSGFMVARFLDPV